MEADCWGLGQFVVSSIHMSQAQPSGRDCDVLDLGAIQTANTGRAFPG
jgi:hypothetical protein